MNTTTQKKTDRRYPRHEYVLEVLILALVSSALVYGVASLNSLPLIA